MGLKKRTTNNPNGRPKGTPNKSTSDLRDWVNGLIEDNRLQIAKDLKSLEPKDRLVIIERLLQYVMPKQQSISVEAQIQAEYAELERMLSNMQEKAINELTERIIKLNQLNKQDNE